MDDKDFCDVCMAIVINLDVMLARRKMRSNELAQRIGITEQNLSILKTGKARAIRLSTLNEIYKHLNCQPGDMLEYLEEDSSGGSGGDLYASPIT